MTPGNGNGKFRFRDFRALLRWRTSYIIFSGLQYFTLYYIKKKQYSGSLFLFYNQTIQNASISSANVKPVFYDTYRIHPCGHTIPTNRGLHRRRSSYNIFFGLDYIARKIIFQIIQTTIKLDYIKCKYLVVNVKQLYIYTFANYPTYYKQF